VRRADADEDFRRSILGMNANAHGGKRQISPKIILADEFEMVMLLSELLSEVEVATADCRQHPIQFRFADLRALTSVLYPLTSFRRLTADLWSLISDF